MAKGFCDICGRPIGAQPDGKIMNKRRGRPPKDDKRDNSYRLRLNAEERQILEQISKQTEQPIATVIRKAVVEKRYREMSEGYMARIQKLNSDCQALANRCFALTQGSMCVFCELSDYRCKHAMSIDDKIKAAKKLMEETNNA